MSDARTAREPIAVVGIGCRLPGADNAHEFWRLLVEGRDAIREIPSERFDVGELFDPAPATPGRIMTRWAGVLDRLDEFDAQFFGIAPREADLVDPQQRLLLEVSWEALEDAGIPASSLPDTDTGVFVGLWLNEYESRMFRDYDEIDFYKTLGTGRYSASGRLSYFYGFRGPSITVDTACSSSLVAVYLACKSLWSGECGVALAGGANTILEPFITIAYSQSKMMAPDGRCKFGDARGDGYVRSDGAGIIVLKRLSDAVAAGNPIYAVIRGGAVNNDGRGSGFLATPAQDGQIDLLRKAYRDAGVSPGSVQYVEAHGTGTLAGDPVEIQALGEVLREGRADGSVCRLGSVKTNVGHTESAAGVVGLMKVALGLKHGLIPRSLNFSEPNPRIPWQSLPVAIQTESSAWPEGHEHAIAGVSAFGIAGTNAHLVLQAAPGTAADGAARTPTGDRSCVLLLSGHTERALSESARRWADWVKTDTGSSYADLCHTAAVRRVHHDHRLGVVARSGAEAAEALAAFSRGDARPNVVSGRRSGNAHKSVFVFPGQGSQWLGMGRSLMEQEPVFAHALGECDAAIAAENGWSVLAELRADETASRLEQIDVVQPVLFSIQVALAALWRSWGIEPAAVVGHSMGEIAAAHVAGVLSLQDAVSIICRRSVLLKRTSGMGGMAVVELSFADAQAALAGREAHLSIAVSNSPRTTVIAGDTQALDALLAELEARDVFCRRIKVNVASHSPQMDPLRADLLAALQDVKPNAASCTFHSTVAGAVLNGVEMDAAYWVRNLREPVRFSTAVQQLIASGHDTFIEMSSHPLLVGAVQEMLRDANVEGLALASARRDEHEPSIMLGSLAALHVAGVDVPWERHYDSTARVVATPTYVWQRERYWYDAAANSGPKRQRTNDLLGDAFQPALDQETFCWNVELSAALFPSLSDHRVRGSIVVPAAMMAELAVEAARRMFGAGLHAVEQLAVTSALVVADGAVTLQAQVALAADGKASFRLVSRPAGANAGTSWTEHATATLRANAAAEVDPAVRFDTLAATGTHLEAAAIYDEMRARALDYGPAYRQITELWRSGASALARLARPNGPTGATGAFEAHAALFDACLQAMLAAAPGASVAGRRDTFVPTAIASLHIPLRPATGTDLYCHASASVDGDTMRGDVALVDGDGRTLLTARGVEMARVQRAEDATLRASYHRLEWMPAPKVHRAADDAGQWIVAGVAGAVAEVLRGHLQAQGARVTLVEGATQLAVALRTASAVRGVICTSMLDASPVPTTELLSAIEIAQALVAGETAGPPRLWFVTENAHRVIATDVSVTPAATSVWGLRASLAVEHPQLRSSSVDVSSVTRDTAALVDELLAGAAEDEIALRNGARFVRQLRAGVAESAPLAGSRPAGGRPFRVMTHTPGILEALGAETMTRRAPAGHQVEIEVEATGLNFMNVLSAMGAYPGYPHGLGPLGIECAGRVARVGTDVSGFSAGDRVAAFAHHSLATHALADARLVTRMPDGMTSEQAATLPIAFLTAYYGLHHLARMRRGDRVLVHAATGGVGLAAIQLAQAAGAEIFATAGSDAKRALLRTLGVQHVSDSRSLAFADDFRAATGGEGVDIVLNSLTGDALVAGINLLRHGGRFVEIGKRDIYDNRAVGLWPFHRNLSYFAVDLDMMAREHAATLGPLLQECMAHVAKAGLRPLPHEAFDVAGVADAFRKMAQGGHTGKIVVRIDRERTPVRPRATAMPADWSAGAVLITGGAGALGLEIAEQLVRRGARDLVLVGRSGESAAVRPRLDALRRKGATVTVARGDVAREEDVSRILADIAARGQSLSGVVHAAGILDDAMVTGLDAGRVESVFAPKVRGAWNLHRLTQDQPLDFFVLFSSVASFIGLAGQANYAAANAWLDGLAEMRRAAGLPALSINWGPWAEVGLAAAGEHRGDRLSARGLHGLTPSVGVAAFDELLRRNPTQAAVMSFDFEAWGRAFPAARTARLFAEFTADVSTDVAAPAATLREQLVALPTGRSRLVHLESFVQHQAAQVLKLSATRIDRTKPLRTMGLDSLMGLELRNRLEAAIQANVPATLVWNYPTIAQLAPQLAVRMGVALDDETATAAEPAVPSASATTADERDDLDSLLQQIEGLSDEDVRRLLAEEA